MIQASAVVALLSSALPLVNQSASLLLPSAAPSAVLSRDVPRPLEHLVAVVIVVVVHGGRGRHGSRTPRRSTSKYLASYVVASNICQALDQYKYL